MKRAIANIGGTASIYIVAILLGSLALYIGTICGWDPYAFSESVAINNNLVNYLLKAVGLLGVLLAYKFVVRRNPFLAIRWKSVLVGLLLAVVFEALRLGYGLAFGPDEMEIVFNPRVPFWFVLVGSGLLFFSVLSEELLIRELLLTELSRLISSKVIIIIIVSLVFTMLHYPQYNRFQLTNLFVGSLVLTYLCILYGNIGYALGIHAGENLYIHLVDHEQHALFLTNFYDSDTSVVVMALLSVPFYIFTIRWINGPIRSTERLSIKSTTDHAIETPASP